MIRSFLFSIRFWKCFFRSTSAENIPALGDEEIVNRLWQASEDQQYEQDIRRMADDMFQQWLEKKPVNYVGIIIAKPVRFTYTIHDEATAKYKDCNFGEKVHQLFDQLKTEILYKYPA